MIVGDHKIAGSAQRRHSGTVLQHGSVLLRKSASAPELPGITDLTGVALTAPQLARLWLAEAQTLLDLSPQRGELSEPEIELARKVQIGKFESADWNRKR